VEVFFKLYKD